MLLHNMKTRNNKQKGKKKKTIKNPLKFKERCAPSANVSVDSPSCYNDESLHKLKDAWNHRHPDDAITTNVPHKIWTQLRQKLSTVCNTERCWLNQNFIQPYLDDHLKSYVFAPTSPAKWNENPTEWLTSTDLTRVMRQYEKAYPHFAFLGPSPIDFDSPKTHGTCVWEELCNFNLQKFIKKNIYKIGIIFNVDPHYKGGSHWIALFINIKKQFIFYFDSNGRPMPVQVKTFIDKVKTQGREFGIEFEDDQNHPFRHQEGNTECGIYCLYFIVSLIKGRHTAQYFKTHKIPDTKMERFRKIFFNKKI